MKLMMVLGSDKTFDNLSIFVKPLGFELIRYRNVQKAMDNIEEIDPAGIIISAKDFPRHWKTMVSFVRFDRPKTECPIVVLKGPTFPEEEISKAMGLKVNGLMLESMEYPLESKEIQSLMARYISGEKKRKKRMYKPEAWNRFGFIFSHPGEDKIITGTVKTVLPTGISIEPDYPETIKNIKVNTEISVCSFRAGKNVFSPVCTLRRKGKTVSLDFLFFPGIEKEIFDIYLENLPREKLKAKQVI